MDWQTCCDYCKIFPSVSLELGVQETSATHSSPNPSTANNGAVAYLAEGKLYVAEPGGQSRLLESPFVQELLDRAARNRQHNEWKAEGMAWNLSRSTQQMLRDPHELVRNVFYTGLASGSQPGEIIYALVTDTVGGLFAYELKTGYERRLIHRAAFQVRELARHPSLNLLAMVVAGVDGSAHIAITESDGRRLREVTEGDSIDEAPCWTEPGKTLVYQTAGIARDRQGYRAALSPYAIHQLDLESGTGTTLLEDEHFDLLCPKVRADGSLLYIHRPYQPHEPPASVWQQLGDIVLFPFRLGRAIVAFLDVFSWIFARKPLITAGGPNRKGPDMQLLWLWGRMIKVHGDIAHAGADQAMVPDSWELRIHEKSGADRLLAKGVLSYDIHGGDVVYSNGSTVKRLQSDGSEQTLFTGRMIERVVFI